MHWDLDLVGLGLAEMVTSLILLGSTMVYARFVPEIREALFWPDSSVWVDWREYFSLGVPATGMMCAEYWAWDILVILAGNLDVKQQANMMITMEVAAILNATCLGMQEAACVLVGN